jgi:hypothetical protein
MFLIASYGERRRSNATQRSPHVHCDPPRAESRSRSRALRSMLKSVPQRCWVDAGAVMRDLRVPRVGRGMRAMTECVHGDAAPLWDDGRAYIWPTCCITPSPGQLRPRGSCLLPGAGRVLWLIYGRQQAG